MDLIPRESGVCACRGFLAAGVRAGIKASGELDLALILSRSPAAAAGVFTTSRAAAAPVVVSRALATLGIARGAVINSGCANAMTGERGLLDAEAMAAEAATRTGVSAGEMLVCSTGLIGSYLPMDRVMGGIAEAAARLGPNDLDAARAMLTTDTRPKRAAVEHADGWRVGGVAKGSGMLAPRMATLLAIITTDARAEPAELEAALRVAVDETFNAVTIDGETSTNDCVLAFANGRSGRSPRGRAFRDAVLAVCRSLAEAIVTDAEGATKRVLVRITGAADPEQARCAARSVAESLLVKSSLHGGDPNWGQVVAAVGGAGVEARFDLLSISMGGVTLLDRGAPADGAAIALARASLSRRDVVIDCHLGMGREGAEMLTTDLSPEYVRINADPVTATV